MTTISRTASTSEPSAVQLRTHPLGCACPVCLPIDVTPKFPPDAEADPVKAAAERAAGGSEAERRHAAMGAVYSLKEDGSLHAPVDATDVRRAATPAGSHVDVKA